MNQTANPLNKDNQFKTNVFIIRIQVSEFLFFFFLNKYKFTGFFYPQFKTYGAVEGTWGFSVKTFLIMLFFWLKKR